MSCERVMMLSMITASTRISFQKIIASSVSFTSVPQPPKGVLISKCVEFCVALRREIRKLLVFLNLLTGLDFVVGHRVAYSIFIKTSENSANSN